MATVIPFPVKPSPGRLALFAAALAEALAAREAEERETSHQRDGRFPPRLRLVR